MKNWSYKKSVVKSLEDLPDYESIVGFVYLITNKKTGKIYVGKKSLFHNRKTKISKKEKLETSTRKRFKTVTKESDWLDYYGSSEELKKDIELLGKESFKREIIEICYSKKYLSFCEIEYQIKLDVLKKDTYNKNILGRYYQKDMNNERK